MEALKDPRVAEKWMWLVEIAIGLAAVIVLSFILRKVVVIVHKVMDKRGGGWRRKINKILHLPLQIALWGFGVAYIVDVAGTHFGLDEISRYVRPLKTAFVVACLCWIILRWIKESFKHLARKSTRLGVDTGTIYALSKLSSFVFSIISLMIILQIFGVGIAPLLAFGGIGVAGVAFAAQDIIANFFGGAMLHFTRNFSVGDEVVIPSKDNFEGEVREIGWYITVIEDYYRRPVYFPNALFTKSQVINESRRTHRRIKETLSIRYDDAPQLEAIINDLRVRIGAHPAVDNTQSFSITLNKLSDYGIDIYIYMLIYQMGYIKFLQAKQELFFIAQEVISDHNAELCYPTHQVFVTNTAPKV